MRKKNFRNDDYYKSLSLFLVGTIGTLLIVYISFGLVMTTIKANRLVNGSSIKRVPSNVGVVKRHFDEDGMYEEIKDIDVIVKELHGKIISINKDLITIETKVYGDQIKEVRLKLENSDEFRISKFVLDDDGISKEVKVGISELAEGSYVGVQLPVEVLLSEMENDLISVDKLIMNSDYKEEEEE